MKQLLGVLFIVLATSVACHTQDNTKVISVGYHSDNCDDCNLLKSKMKKMNRMFLTSSIVFIKYDKTNSKTKLKADAKLKKWGILNEASKEEGLKKVIIYDVQSKQKIIQLDFTDSVEELEKKIRLALEE